MCSFINSKYYIMKTFVSCMLSAGLLVCVILILAVWLVIIKLGNVCIE